MYWLILPPPLLAFFLELLELGDDDREQLQDDRRADVRHDAEREDRHLLERAAREHVEQAEERARAPGSRSFAMIARLTPGVVTKTPMR